MAGRPGHPVVLGPEQLRALCIVGRRPRRAETCCAADPMVEVGHLAAGRDVDTPDDLEAIRDEARAVV